SNAALLSKTPANSFSDGFDVSPASALSSASLHSGWNAASTPAISPISGYSQAKPASTQVIDMPKDSKVTGSRSKISNGPGHSSTARIDLRIIDFVNCSFVIDPDLYADPTLARPDASGHEPCPPNAIAPLYQVDSDTPTTPDLNAENQQPKTSSIPRRNQHCCCAEIKNFRVTEADPIPTCPCDEKCAGPDYGYLRGVRTLVREFADIWRRYASEEARLLHDHSVMQIAKDVGVTLKFPQSFPYM
ncbi:hypothetical protein H4R20_005527, partial [Coemansia guatemalensis]